MLELASRGARAPSHQAPSRPESAPPRRVEVVEEHAPHAPIEESPAIPRAVRVPMGYLFLAGAGVVALVVMGYLLGYSRASSATRDMERDSAQRELESAVQDPLLEQSPVNPNLLAGGEGESVGAAGATNETRRPAEPRSGGDPRTPGMNYFVVARDLPEEAQRAVEFLESNGVPAMVAPSGNPNLRLVVALRPFTGEEIRAGEHLSFRARIQSLGRIWKRDHDGAADWADAYPAKYSG